MKSSDLFSHPHLFSHPIEPEFVSAKDRDTGPVKAPEFSDRQESAKERRANSENH
jgi:hypothetical protein